jgi:hypothetical protein
MTVRRGTRWVIGSVITVVLVLISLTALVVTASVGFVRGIDWSDDERYTGRADAVVLDVDPYDDEFDGADDPPGDDPLDDWVTVDVDYRTAGGERVVTTFDWPPALGEPAVGDTVRIAYDPEYPERVQEVGDVDPLAAEKEAAETDPDLTPGYLTAGLTGALALVALVLTIVWATRAPRPEVRPRPYAPQGRWGYPPPYGPAGPGAAPPPYPLPPPGYPAPPAPPPPPPGGWPTP